MRFFRGGPSGDSNALRDVFNEDLGCVLADLPDTECLDIGAIVHIAFGELRRLIDVGFEVEDTSNRAGAEGAT